MYVLHLSCTQLPAYSYIIPEVGSNAAGIHMLCNAFSKLYYQMEREGLVKTSLA